MIGMLQVCCCCKRRGKADDFCRRAEITLSVGREMQQVVCGPVRTWKGGAERCAMPSSVFDSVLPVSVRGRRTMALWVMFLAGLWFAMSRRRGRWNDASGQHGSSRAGSQKGHKCAKKGTPGGHNGPQICNVVILLGL